MVIIGKALAGGFYPVSAVLASKEILGVFHPGDHGSTFGGNPLGCAVARAALQVLVEEKLVERSAELGEYFLDRAATLRSPHLREIRGKGLWIGIELDVPARPYCEALKELGRALQGDARLRDSHRAAAGDHARGDRLGVRADPAGNRRAGVKSRHS